jgi:hypothetical protein
MIDLILERLGIGFDYLIAVALIVAGLYLALVLANSPAVALFSKALRYVGAVLVALGIAVGCIAYGKSVGAADIEAAWKAKNYEAQVARLKQEAAAKQIAADTAAAQADQLAKDNDAKQQLIAKYEAALAASPTCRRSSDDDDRMLCDVIGGAAAGCKHPK